MKRHGKLYERFCERGNFEFAHDNASRHKSGKRCVVKFNEDREANIDRLLESHRSSRFTSSNCSRRTIKDKKKMRVLSIRPYNPDKVTQHAVINVAEPIWRNSFTRDTYSNLKRHGLHQCVQKLKQDLHADPEGTRYCLQIDLVHHYPNMDHDVIKKSVRRKIKDNRLLCVIDNFVDTMDGLSLGDPISGWLENVVMTPFDHKVKEVYKIRYYYRFKDDMVFLSDDKKKLHRLLNNIEKDIDEIDQSIKGNWQIYPVDSRGIDFIGYRFFHGFTLLRKSIKQDIFRLIAKYGRGEVPEEKFRQSIQSRLGWLKWCDSYRLQAKIKLKIKEAEKRRNGLNCEGKRNQQITRKNKTS